MKITDLKCGMIGTHPVVRIVTDQGISGYGQAEHYKPYLKPFILQFREALAPLLGALYDERIYRPLAARH